jgi:hypothetical protein
MNSKCFSWVAVIVPECASTFGTILTRPGNASGVAISSWGTAVSGSYTGRPCDVVRAATTRRNWLYKWHPSFLAVLCPTSWYRQTTLDWQLIPSFWLGSTFTKDAKLHGNGLVKLSVKDIKVSCTEKCLKINHKPEHNEGILSFVRAVGLKLILVNAVITATNALAFSSLLVATVSWSWWPLLLHALLCRTLGLFLSLQGGSWRIVLMLIPSVEITEGKSQSLPISHVMNVTVVETWQIWINIVGRWAL